MVLFSELVCVWVLLVCVTCVLLVCFVSKVQHITAPVMPTDLAIEDSTTALQLAQQAVDSQESSTFDDDDDTLPSDTAAGSSAAIASN